MPTPSRRPPLSVLDLAIVNAGGTSAEALAATVPAPIEFVGVKDTFGSSGEPEELAYAYEIAAPFIAAAARKVLKRRRAGTRA